MYSTYAIESLSKDCIYFGQTKDLHIASTGEGKISRLMVGVFLLKGAKNE